MAARGRPDASAVSVLQSWKMGSWMHADQEKDRFQGAYLSPPRFFLRSLIAASRDDACSRS